MQIAYPRSRQWNGHCIQMINRVSFVLGLSVLLICSGCASVSKNQSRTVRHISLCAVSRAIANGHVTAEASHGKVFITTAILTRGPHYADRLHGAGCVDDNFLFVPSTPQARSMANKIDGILWKYSPGHLPPYAIEIKVEGRIINKGLRSVFLASSILSYKVIKQKPGKPYPKNTNICDLFLCG